MRKKGAYIIAWAIGLVILFTPLRGTVMAAGGQETTYTDENGETRIIYWVDGIIPPRMVPNDPSSDFQKVTDKIGDAEYVDYVTKYIPDQGWYDVNKTPDQAHDANLCFSAAASNTLHWWFDRNSGYIDTYLGLHPNTPQASEIKELKNSPSDQQGSKIYARFAQQFADRQTGFWPDLLQDQFINGYTPKENGGVNDPDYDGPDLIQKGPDKRGGFFYNVFGPDILTGRRFYDYASYQDLSGDLKSFIGRGDSVTLTYDMGASAHVVTLWGAEYDSSGNLCGVYYTDSDDGAEYGMHRYRVIDRNGVPYVTTDTRNDGSGSKVSCVTTLSTGKAIWERITAQPKTELELVWGKTEFIYNGLPQKPELTTWSIMEGDDAVLSVEGEGIAAGSYTASAKLTGVDMDKYTLPAESTKDFVILQSGTAFLDGIKISYENEETDIFNKGDTISVQVTPRATGARPSESAEPLPSVVPTNGKMSLYYRSSLLSGPVSADGKGSYTMTCIASDENFDAGAHKLTVRFHGDSNMADYEESVTITIADDRYTSIDKVSPTCEKPGKKAHFTDSQGKFYIEENGVKKEVKEQDLIIPATGHSPGKWIQKDDRHFQECLNGCGLHLNEADCSGGAATVTEEAVCEICGNPYGERLEKPVEPSEKYEIISGADGVHVASSDDELTFRVSGAFSKFIGIKVDGTVVDKSFYTAISGSTIITLKTEYLNTLSVGKHTLEFEYIDGTVSCSFKIADESQVPPEVNPPKPDLPQSDDRPQAENPKSPDKEQDGDLAGKTLDQAVNTGDDFSYRIWIYVLALSGGCLIFMHHKKNKKFNHKK